MKNQNENINTNDVFFIKAGSEYIKINPQDVFMIEAMGDYIIIHSNHKKYKVHSTMRSIINNLPANEYIRIHNSYIVRIDKITGIKMGTCTVNKKIIPIGRSHHENLLKKIKVIAP